MTCLQSGWPEPVVRVQSLAEGGITAIPERYIKPANDRPILINHNDNNLNLNNNNIPVIDLQHVYSNNKVLRDETLIRVSDACRNWGFFQVVNHGVSHELMSRMREVWRGFFNLPLEMKQELANNPSTYEGYGSRLGVEKGAILDWSDYFFLNYLPLHLRNPNKWPTLPTSCRDLVAEYGNEVVKLCGRLMKILSLNLGLGEDQLQNAFGGENIGATMRANFYPKCPQPDLTLGLSSHSDPGGITLLLPDENVAGLQVRRADGSWVTVKPVPNAFIVNIGDQIQVLSNAIFKSVEHRVIVNSSKERVSLAFFYNPKSDILIEPIKDLVTEDRPALYQPMTYDQYRLYIRIKGPSGKKQVESLMSST
ncbi:leucoanthocyanidin dioxygenase-like [Tripterygium wilfordii]|uniref:Leucoanthocyanidin dioxygenase-like n=1 Tax=Tripterygium wilfordii TaxID=458696 RepID=A0A7J7DNF6_TRIWF|nr:probable 2-oxoglutarate-dependent dioxygenase At5g05600 [Tripterygium wilfordii]KAF5747626.1 leucoanthocyanidin dioxygenase-like [Tripterygium wilfordii]